MQPAPLPRRISIPAMKSPSSLILLLAVITLAACDKPAESAGAAKTLSEARRGFTPRILRFERTGVPAEEPPPELFSLVRYPSPAGLLAAYVSKPAAGAKKLPAIIWI